MKGKPALIEALFRLPPRDGVFAVDRLVLLAIAGSRPVTLADEEDCSRNRRELFNLLVQRMEKGIARGLARTFDIVDPESYLLRWRECKTRREHIEFHRIPAVLRFLDGLDDREYEFAGGLACRSLGATKVLVTPGSGDDSIDFFSIIPAYTQSTLICAGRDGLRIVGQAKMYRMSRVAEDQVKLLLQTMEGIRHRSPDYMAGVPSWFLGSRAPIVGWMVGHSGFQSGASSHGKSHGLILSDGVELASIIAGSKLLGYATEAPQIELLLKTLLDKEREGTSEATA